jgi:3-dehydroquinate dehydratase/shikimate dehydrogenase
MIIVSVTGPTVRDALKQIQRSVRFADLFELRLDMISKPDIPRLISATRKPVIATCRPVWEGGRYRGSEQSRVTVLEEAAASGAAYIDLELAVAREAIQRFRRASAGPRIICSRHIYSPQRFSVRTAYRQLSSVGADVIKLAYTAGDACDNRFAAEFLALARGGKARAIAVAMGPYGEPSRILYRKFGGWATFASPEEGSESAPGQIPAGLMKGLYRADRLTRRARVFGVVGNPLTQSKGIYVHNAMLGDDDAVYCRFLVRQLGRFMREFAPYLHGFSVTIPFKEEIMRYLSRVDRSAKPIRAVNTVVRRRGGFWGTNSDAPGAMDAIETAVSVRGRTVLIVGAGGTARAIAYEAKKRGAEVIIANRTVEKGERLAREFGLGFVRMKEIRGVSFDILVNATSVGMVPNAGASPVPSEILRHKIVLDAVYNPPRTKLLRDAEAKGSRVVGGAEMFLNQAAIQSLLFTGRIPNMARMRRVLHRASAEHSTRKRGSYPGYSH